MKNCKTCQEDKPLEQFAKMAKAPDGIQYSCRPCQSRTNSAAMAQKREWIAEYKVGVGCTDCGYNRWPEALDFDHLNDDKVRSPSDMLGCSWPRIVAEIEKCEVVCANCHRHRTWMRQQERGEVVQDGKGFPS